MKKTDTQRAFNGARLTLGKTLMSVVCAATVVFSGQRAVATPIFEDGFNYSVGTLGTNAPWGNPTSFIKVLDGGLAYPGLANFSPTGKVAFVSRGIDATTAITSRNFISAVNGTVYVSCLINYTSVNANVYIAGLLPSSVSTPGGPTVDPCDLVVKLAGSGYNLGIRGKGVGASYASTVLPLNTTHFIVLKYNFSTRQASLYLNPSPVAAEPPSASVNSVGTSTVNDINKFFIRSSGSAAGDYFVDAVRVGSTWADVTPSVPILPADRLTFSGTPDPGTVGKAMQNITVQIANADGFNVASNNVPVTLTLNSNSLAGGTTTLNSDANGKLVFSNLVINSPGTYTMIATGSGIGAGLSLGTSAQFEIGQTNAISAQGKALSIFLDSLEVEKYWSNGVSVNWFTGAAGGVGPNMTQGTASHCSAFAPAVAKLMGVYLLSQPEVSDMGLANVQADWLETNASSGWFSVGSHVEAQHLANAGQLVVASLQEEVGSGHIAVLRPSTKSDAEVNAFGAQECQSGFYNYNDTDVKTGFGQHADPLLRVRYYGYSITNVPPPVGPRFRSTALSEGKLHADVTSIVGRKYNLQWSLDLTNWFNTLSYTNSNSGTEFFCDTTLIDTNLSGTTRRFYRLMAK